VSNIENLLSSSSELLENIRNFKRQEKELLKEIKIESKINGLISSSKQLVNDVNTFLKKSDTEVKAAIDYKRKEGNTHKQKLSGKGYHYSYDENGKLVPTARLLVEKKLGRKLMDFETVIYRDKNPKNINLSNLTLGLRPGTPLEVLKCKCCGARGDWEIRS